MLPRRDIDPTFVTYTQAPGKVMLAGEYAVLDGCASVVMAVDRYATASASLVPLTDADGWETPEALAALEDAISLGYLQHKMHTRVRPGTLFDQGQTRKLGLGSSAAMCVAALGSAKLLSELQSVNTTRTPPPTLDRMTLAKIARKGHRRAQGGGSGVDVIASALGGIHAITITGNGEDFLCEALQWPDEIHWRVLWTGDPVSTKLFVAKVRELSTHAPTQYAKVMGPLRESAQEFLRGMRAAHASLVFESVRSHGEAMDALGQSAGVPIVTESMRELVQVANRSGCAVKPSGAGGGDIVLLVATSADAIAECLTQLPASMVCVSMNLSTEGVGPLKGSHSEAKPTDATQVQP